MKITNYGICRIAVARDYMHSPLNISSISPLSIVTTIQNLSIVSREISKVLFRDFISDAREEESRASFVLKPRGKLERDMIFNYHA